MKRGVILSVASSALFVHHAHGWTALRTTARRFRQGRFLAAMMLCSALLGIQLWLFVWAPLHGYALDVSMGYFLLRQRWRSVAAAAQDAQQHQQVGEDVV